MNRVWPTILLLCIAATAAGTDKAKSGPSPRERLDAIKKEYKAAEDAFSKARDTLPDTAEGNEKKQELYKAYDKDRSDRFMAAVELARGDPKSEAGFAALEWVLTIPRSFYLPAGKPAMQLMTEHHARNPKIGKVVAWVGYLRPGGTENEAAATALIRAVAEKNPDKTARGQAILAIALAAKSKFAVAEYRHEPHADQLAAEAEKAFEAIVKDYADCPRLLREDAVLLGEVAGSELYELRHLRIGKPAPDIQGEDLDGVKFKLSDYRGKVVVLDFWGDW